MLFLPPEIWNEIFRYLPAIDILNLPYEITTQNLTVDKAEAKFKVFCAVLTLQSLSQLSRIAYNPVLNQCLRYLSLEIQALSCMPCTTAWDLGQSVENRHVHGDMSIGQRHLLARRIFKEQQILRRRRLDVKILTNVFAHLPSLKSIVIDGKREDIQQRRKVERNADYIQMSEMLKDEYHHQVARRDPSATRHVASVVSEALYAAQTALTHFGICAYDRSGDMPRHEPLNINLSHLVNHVSPLIIRKCCRKLKHVWLTSLSVSGENMITPLHSESMWLTAPSRSPRQIKDGLGLVIQQIVAFSAQMTHLHIGLEQYRNGTQRRTQWYDFPLAALHLNKLQALSVLCLTRIDTREEELAATLIGCASTLRSLELQSITLMRGSWLSFFERMKGRLRLAQPLDCSQFIGEYHFMGRIIGFNCEFLHAYSPELANIAGENVGELLPKPDFETDIKPIWRWLCSEYDLNPFWKGQMGDSRFTHCYYSNSPDVSDEEIYFECQRRPEGREIVNLDE